MKQRLLWGICLLCAAYASILFSIPVYAQSTYSGTAVPLGVGTTSPNSNTILDLSNATNAMLLPVGTTGQEPTGVAGMIRYNSTTTNVEYYNGSTWSPFRVTGGPTAGSGYIVPSRGQFNGCLGSVVYTITNSGTTATVTTASYGSGVAAHDLSTGQSVTITGATPSAYNGTFTITVTSTSTFTYTMASNPGGSDTNASATVICPDSGGLTLANKLCLNDLTNFNGWYGYSTANSAGLLTSAHVKAFLCDGSSCNNLDANTTYYFGDNYDNSEGSASFTTNASGYGPNDNINWLRADHVGYMEYLFANSQYYWTGRGTGTTNTWPGTSATNTCSGWTSTSGNGEYGTPSAGTTRWASNIATCLPANVAYAPNLLCLVNP